MRLSEYKGNTVSPQDYQYLYHLCDHHSYAYAMEHNALKSHTGELSTTWDRSLQHVVGRSHLDFKFVLDAKKLISQYGAHHYDDHGYVGSEYQSHDEREIRIETKIVTPLDNYLLGTCIMFDLFSEKGLQWLLYDNHKTDGFLQASLDAAGRSINYLIQQEQKGIPVWIGNVGIGFTADQKSFLQEVKRISDLGVSFTDALEIISDIVPIKDHDGKIVDKHTYMRRHMAPTIVKLLNQYYAGRSYLQVKVPAVKRLVTRIIEILKVGDNFSKASVSIIEQYGLFSKKTQAAEWAGIIQTIMDMDEEGLVEICKFYKNVHDRTEISKYSTHYGTSFGRLVTR
jgi:hypothetical protein